MKRCSKRRDFHVYLFGSRLGDDLPRPPSPIDTPSYTLLVRGLFCVCLVKEEEEEAPGGELSTADATPAHTHTAHGTFFLYLRGVVFCGDVSPTHPLAAQRANEL